MTNHLDLAALCRCALQASQGRLFWLLLATLCLGLEAGALFYQHVLHVLPCELCIYVRVWLAAIFLVSLAALSLRRWVAGRAAVIVATLLLSLGLLNESWNLIVVEYGFGTGGGCNFFPNFPAWAPLDQWLPFFFEVQEFCLATPELLFGITMAQALLIISGALVLLFLCQLLGVLMALRGSAAIR